MKSHMPPLTLCTAGPNLIIVYLLFDPLPATTGPIRVSVFTCHRQPTAATWPSLPWQPSPPVQALLRRRHFCLPLSPPPWQLRPLPHLSTPWPLPLTARTHTPHLLVRTERIRPPTPPQLRWEGGGGWEWESMFVCTVYSYVCTYVLTYVDSRCMFMGWSSSSVVFVFMHSWCASNVDLTTATNVTGCG